jgi:hypothetical protein
MNKFVIILISILSFHNAPKKADEIVLDFYNWYLSSIKNLPPREYSPTVEIDSSGMLVLSIEQYIQNLRKYSCSEDLIEREISSYQECAKNLTKLKFEILQSDFDYDEVGCDFVYYNRWTHSQEPVDGIKIIETKKIQKDKQMVKGQFYNYDEATVEYLYWNWYCYVLLIQESGKWKIDSIEIKKEE